MRAIAHCALWIASSVLAVPAAAQSSDELLRGVRGVIDLLGQPQQGRGGTGVSRPDLGRDTRRDEVVPPTPGVFPSSRALLDAARRGVVAEVHQASEPDKKQFRLAIYAILTNESRVPPFGYPCMNAFDRDVDSLFFPIARSWQSQLTDRPPDFFYFNQAAIDRVGTAVQTTVSSWQQRPTICDSNVGGRTVPHPYKDAMVQLLVPFSDALQVFYTDEGNRRKQAYAAQVGRAQQANAAQRQQAAQEQAAQRAAAQQSLEAENARIRAEEQRRAERERNRIGG
ncbi:MAG: hypothetical protein EON54_05550 [Alcaligenaceae bacterium]|nr:MAG: hypothetical protein EON54_05550 [Alcaligenaceae bacterium]